jgi:hypothetical protein
MRASERALGTAAARRKKSKVIHHSALSLSYMLISRIWDLLLLLAALSPLRCDTSNLIKIKTVTCISIRFRSGAARGGAAVCRHSLEVSKSRVRVTHTYAMMDYWIHGTLIARFSSTFCNVEAVCCFGASTLALIFSFYKLNIVCGGGGISVV